MTLAAIAAALTAGLASTTHCAVMCGPIAFYAGQSYRGLLSYHGSRLLAYGALGIVVGATGTLLETALPMRWAGALTSGMLATALLLLAYQVWPKNKADTELVPLRRRPLVPDRCSARGPTHAALIGGLTAFLPCGALYSALLIASGSGTSVGGALSMVTFAAASAAGLGVFGVIATRFGSAGTPPRVNRWIRCGAAAILITGSAMLLAQLTSSFSSDPSTEACPLHPPVVGVRSPRFAGRVDVWPTGS